MQKTKISLQKWFLVIGLVVSAEKDVSSRQLARDLDLNQKTAWYMVMRIRQAMVSDSLLLSGILDANESHKVGNSRKRNAHWEGTEVPSGHGTRKPPVLCSAERGGRIVAELSQQISAAPTDFLGCHFDSVNSVVTA